ncbi:MAG: efflux RND transporter periplasmic adaptor subunit [Gammaproteobacteria bacterium]|nr:efflux RND transporter periplasmic adaptor subunit [Gammaproteobacteria bacterium]
MSEKGSRDELQAVSPAAESAPAIARLCYVDDSRTSAYVVRRLLQPYGYRVDHFSSAEPAFVALIQQDYDLLLTDLKVSATGMDGDDLIRTLRNSGHAKISKLPIIVITGASDAQSLVDVYDAGANQVLKKPVNADELDGHIRRFLFDGRQLPTAPPDNTVVSLPTAHRPSPVPHPRPLQPVDRPPSPTSLIDSVPVLTTAAIDVRATAGKTPAPASPVKAHVPPETAAATTTAAASRQKPTPPSEPAIDAQAHAAPTATVDDTPDPHQEEPVIIEPGERPGRRAADTRVPSDENILQDLDQYALVVTERSGLLERSGIVGYLHSLIELVGARNLLRRVLISAAVLLLLITGWSLYFNQGLPVETALVESGEIFQSISVPGRIVSKQRVDVSPARSGRLIEILAREGDKVTKAQVLARLDDRELLSRLNSSKAILSNAREDIVLAERTLARLQKAHAKGAVARRFVEDAEIDLRSAKTRAGVALEEVRSATLDVGSQQIKAPFDGTVTARLAEIGQWVGPADSLFTLVDESQREIEVRVDSADSVAIDVGQVVAVSSDAFPGLEWEESVVRLGTATDNKSNANSVKVYISLGKDAPLLRIGQQVDTDIRTAWNPNTLKVPFEALINRDGQTLVAVLEAGRVRMKTVETGIEDFAMAEIKQGLNEGEMVILSKGRLLQNGDRVHPARAGR